MPTSYTSNHRQTQCRIAKITSGLCTNEKRLALVVFTCVSLGFPYLVFVLRHLSDAASAQYVNTFSHQSFQFAFLVLAGLSDLLFQKRQAKLRLPPLAGKRPVDRRSCQRETAVIGEIETMDRVAFPNVATPRPFVLVVAEIVRGPVLLKNMHLQWIISRSLTGRNRQRKQQQQNQGQTGRKRALHLSLHADSATRELHAIVLGNPGAVYSQFRQ